MRPTQFDAKIVKFHEKMTKFGETAITFDGKITKFDKTAITFDGKITKFYGSIHQILREYSPNSTGEFTKI